MSFFNSVEIIEPQSIREQIKKGYGKCVEILHVGSYDNEPSSFEKMDRFTQENGLQRISDFHREVYLTNRTKADKLKTILRSMIFFLHAL